ncbi:MAG: restriction endonuclease [Candidatus Heimdallarchaeota archaeon]|nr:restriction endonuclease [Candidatus Heimdallarchaeota archaeon]
MENIESMTGEEFELLITDLFRRMGYENVINRKLSGDGGIDIEALDPEAERSIAVQCKKRSGGKKISRSFVQLIDSARRYENFDQGMIVTNTNFTRPARDLAKELNISLIDDFKLKTLLNTHYKRRKENKENQMKDSNNQEESSIPDAQHKEAAIDEELEDIGEEFDEPSKEPMKYIDKLCRYCGHKLKGVIEYCELCEWPFASEEFGDPVDELGCTHSTLPKVCSVCDTTLQGMTAFCSKCNWHYNGAN